MEIREALDIVEALARGVDPATGEVFGESSPYCQETISEALRLCAERIRHPPRKTIRERRTENLERGRPGNAGLPWSDTMREQLAAAFHEGATLGDLARRFQRSRGAVLSELKRQGLVKDYWHRQPEHADPAAS